jgi:hypothetical protein
MATKIAAVGSRRAIKEIEKELLEELSGELPIPVGVV